MNKKIKSTAVLIAAAMIASGALTSCGKNSGDNAAKKPTLKILMNNISVDPNTYTVAKLLEEKTGYKVQYDLLPSDNAEEKLNLILSSQEEYDGIQILGAYRQKFITYAKQGALTELDELVDKYGENIKSAMLPESFELGTVNDKLYGIVTSNGVMLNEDGTSKPSFMGTMLLVRTDIMNKAGITKMPETIDEFTDMLRAMKKVGDGSSMSQAPLTTTSNINLPGIDGAFGVADEWIDNGDGTLKHRVETEKYKNYILYLKSLHDEGLLDSEIPVNKTNTMQEKYTSGKSYVMPMAYYDAATIMDALDKNCPGYSVDYLLPIKGENGDSGYTYGGMWMNRVMVIPKSAEHPEDMMKWINAKLDKDLFREIVIGEEGVDYEIKDGDYYPILPAFTEHRSLANDFLSGLDDRVYMDYWQARVRKDDRIYNMYLKGGTDEVLSTAHKSLTADAPVFEASSKKSALDTIVKDYVLGVIAGAESIDNYDTFLNKWYNEGGKALVDETNAWYSQKSK